MFDLVVLKPASNRLRRMPVNVAQTIRAKIDNVAKNPSAPHNNVQALKGSDILRLRVGDWRVLYRLDTETKTMTIIEIRPRGEAYR